jgi:hypothetical protein
VETIISPLFLRLSVQSILYIDTRASRDRQAFASELTHVCHRKGEMPEMFETLEEARCYINEAADGLFRMFYMLVVHIIPESWNNILTDPGLMATNPWSPNLQKHL